VYSYNATLHGRSGNMTVNGKSTCDLSTLAGTALARRGVGAAAHPDVDVNTPPYAIHNGAGRLALNTLAPNATHHGGSNELDMHNLFGTLEEIATNAALKTLRPGQRPFIIGRSTFAGVGKYSGHWVWPKLPEACEEDADARAARRQLQLVVVPALHDPGRAPVPALPDSDGRRGHVRLQREQRRGALQPLDAGCGLHAILPQPQHEERNLAGAFRVGQRCGGEPRRDRGEVSAPTVLGTFHCPGSEKCG
jgi:hypothetical protein